MHDDDPFPTKETRAEAAQRIMGGLRLDPATEAPEVAERLSRESIELMRRHDALFELPGSEQEQRIRLGYYVGEVLE